MNPNNSKLPNTFLIGAAKSGTSSLAFMLKQHPQIFLPSNKEPHFFSDDKRYSKGIEWYLDSFFSGSESFGIRLDASNAYLVWSEKTVKRLLKIYEKPEKLKFIALLRDPVARAFSHFWMAKRLGREPLDFEEAIRQESARLELHDEEFRLSGEQKFGYFKGGAYATNVSPFLQAFSRDQFRFLIFDDFKKNSIASVNNVFEFLEIEKFKVEPLHKNPASLPRSRIMYDYMKKKDAGTKNFIKRLFPLKMQKKLKEMIMKLVLRPIKKSAIPQQVENELRSRFAPEIRKLEKILDRDLSDWY